MERPITEPPALFKAAAWLVVKIDVYLAPKAALL
jgi:hypothetical protein